MNLPLLPPPPPQPLALPGTDLEPAGQELVLHLQVVALVDLRLEGLVEDHVSRVVLDVLPAGIAMPGGAPLRANPAMGRGRGAGLRPASWLCALRLVINLGCRTTTSTPTAALGGPDRAPRLPGADRSIPSLEGGNGVLTSGPVSECGLIWEECLCGCNQGRKGPDWVQVATNPVTDVLEEEEIWTQMPRKKVM